MIMPRERAATTEGTIGQAEFVERFGSPASTPANSTTTSSQRTGASQYDDQKTRRHDANLIVAHRQDAKDESDDSDDESDDSMAQEKKRNKKMLKNANGGQNGVHDSSHHNNYNGAINHHPYGSYGGGHNNLRSRELLLGSPGAPASVSSSSSFTTTSSTTSTGTTSTTQALQRAAAIAASLDLNFLVEECTEIQNVKMSTKEKAKNNLSSGSLHSNGSTRAKRNYVHPKMLSNDDEDDDAEEDAEMVLPPWQGARDPSHMPKSTQQKQHPFSRQRNGGEGESGNLPPWKLFHKTAPAPTEEETGKQRHNESKPPGRSNDNDNDNHPANGISGTRGAEPEAEADKEPPSQEYNIIAPEALKLPRQPQHDDFASESSPTSAKETNDNVRRGFGVGVDDQPSNDATHSSDLMDMDDILNNDEEGDSEVWLPENPSATFFPAATVITTTRKDALSDLANASETFMLFEDSDFAVDGFLGSRRPRGHGGESMVSSITASISNPEMAKQPSWRTGRFSMNDDEDVAFLSGDSPSDPFPVSLPPGKLVTPHVFDGGDDLSDSSELSDITTESGDRMLDGNCQADENKSNASSSGWQKDEFEMEWGSIPSDDDDEDEDIGVFPTETFNSELLGAAPPARYQSDYSANPGNMGLINDDDFLGDGTTPIRWSTNLAAIASATAGTTGILKNSSSFTPKKNPPSNVTTPDSHSYASHPSERPSNSSKLQQHFQQQQELRQQELERKQKQEGGDDWQSFDPLSISAHSIGEISDVTFDTALGPPLSSCGNQGEGNVEDLSQSPVQFPRRKLKYVRNSFRNSFRSTDLTKEAILEDHEYDRGFDEIMEQRRQHRHNLFPTADRSPSKDQQRLGEKILNESIEESDFEAENPAQKRPQREAGGRQPSQTDLSQECDISNEGGEAQISLPSRVSMSTIHVHSEGDQGSLKDQSSLSDDASSNCQGVGASGSVSTASVSMIEKSPKKGEAAATMAESGSGSPLPTKEIVSAEKSDVSQDDGDIENAKMPPVASLLGSSAEDPEDAQRSHALLVQYLITLGTPPAAAQKLAVKFAEQRVNGMPDGVPGASNSARNNRQPRGRQRRGVARRGKQAAQRGAEARREKRFRAGTIAMLTPRPAAAAAATFSMTTITEKLHDDSSHSRTSRASRASRAASRSSRSRTPSSRIWTRFEEPGAVQMEGRAYGARPRSPGEGLPRAHTPSPTPQALEEQPIPSELVEEDSDDGEPIEVVYAESSPLSLKVLIKEWTVQRVLILGIIGAATLIAGLCVIFIQGSRSSPRGIASPTPTSTPTSTPTFHPTQILDDFLTTAATVSGWDVVMMSGSPQRRAVTWLSTFDQIEINASSPGFIQRYVLVVLYFATRGDVTWTDTQNWLDPTLHECDWGHEMITCVQDPSSSLLVSGLDLSRNDLRGTIPDEISQLTQLETLQLYQNALRGTIPSQLYNLTRLATLELGSNVLTGSISEDISRLSNLELLGFSKNQLEGSIPDSLYDLALLQRLQLNDNMITGTLAAALGKLKVLTTFDVRSNRISGSIPVAFDDIPNLDFILLDDNRLTGFLPQWSGALVTRQELTVARNLLSGTLPGGNLSLVGGNAAASSIRLKKIDMSHNNIHGALPVLLAVIPSLTHLDISGNQFTGVFPDVPDAGFWNSIEILRANDNKLQGPVPSAFSKSITHLDLSGNDMDGGVPVDLSRLPNLSFLSLNDNNLGGQIPVEVARMPNLKKLEMRNCSLTGSIPGEIAQHMVESVDVGHNSLTGTIFFGFDNFPTLKRLRFESNALTGTIPSELGLLKFLDVLTLANNSMTGTIPEELALLSVLDEFTVVGNMLEGTVPLGLCNVIDSLSVRDVGCDLVCTCCRDTETCPKEADDGL